MRAYLRRKMSINFLLRGTCTGGTQCECSILSDTVKKGDVLYTNFYLEHECHFKEGTNHDEW